MQTDKYTKVILTLIAIGIFSLGCGGGASLEEVNELRQEIAALKEAVEQNNVEELRLEIAALRDSVDRAINTIDLKLEIALAPLKVSDMVRTRYLEIVNGDGKIVIAAGADGSDNGRLEISNKSGQAVIYAGTGTDGDGDGLFAVNNKSGQAVIYAGVNSDETGGYIAVDNKTGQSVVTLGVDEYGNGEVGAWNRKGKGRVFDSK